MSKKIEKFEDFIAWQKARQLSRQIYQATNLPGFSRDFGLKDQIRRSAVSIMSTLPRVLSADVRRNFISSSRLPKLLAQSYALNCMLPSMLITFLSLSSRN